MNRRTMIMTTAAAATLPLAPTIGRAAEPIVVEMLNKDPDNPRNRYVFAPRVLSVQPGDTVLFKSVDRGHNSQSIKDMLPEGAEDWNSKINDDFEMTFDTPGFYGYACTPHSTVGMVGLIVVEGEGKMDNLETAQGVRHRGKSKKAWEEIWEEAEAAGLLEATTA
ncbi:MAG: pseudoazurin [Pseudomonadota bacterium]